MRLSVFARYSQNKSDKGFDWILLAPRPEVQQIWAFDADRFELTCITSIRQLHHQLRKPQGNLGENHQKGHSDDQNT